MNWMHCLDCDCVMSCGHGLSECSANAINANGHDPEKLEICNGCVGYQNGHAGWCPNRAAVDADAAGYERAMALVKAAYKDGEEAGYERGIREAAAVVMTGLRAAPGIRDVPTIMHNGAIEWARAAILAIVPEKDPA